MPRLSLLSAPFMLGFDSFEERIDRLSKSADSYPPYNIERLATSKDAETYQITIAVAGFSCEELKIVSEDTQLHISGDHQQSAEREFLHRGIATRQFKRSFLLADGMIIIGANLYEGMLTIDVQRPLTEKVSRVIEISLGSGV